MLSNSNKMVNKWKQSLYS